MTIYDFVDYLCCPDCKGNIKEYRDDLKCANCGRIFKVYHEICADMIPKKPFLRTPKTHIEKRSIEVYNRLFYEQFAWKEHPNPWGLEIPESYKKKVNKHKYMVYRLLPESVAKFIDISAGSGRFSWDLVEKAALCVFCDISVDSVVYLSKKALEEKRTNVIVIRSDYTSPPFKSNIFDLCFCQDTLIYGYEHEMKLLDSIYRILSKKGIAILDFSNKYHRGFWHKPYTYGYSKKEMIEMLKSKQFFTDAIVPLYYELSYDLDETNLFSRILKLLLPPTRYIFRVHK